MAVSGSTPIFYNFRQQYTELKQELNRALTSVSPDDVGSTQTHFTERFAEFYALVGQMDQAATDAAEAADDVVKVALSTQRREHQEKLGKLGGRVKGFTEAVAQRGQVLSRVEKADARGLGSIDNLCGRSAFSRELCLEVGTVAFKRLGGVLQTQESLEREVGSLKEDQERLNETLSAARQQLETVSSELNLVNAEVGRLTDRLEGAEEERDGALDAKSALMKAGVSTERQIARLTQEKAELEGGQEELQVLLDQTQRRLADLEEMLESRVAPSLVRTESRVINERGARDLVSTLSLGGGLRARRRPMVHPEVPVTVVAAPAETVVEAPAPTAEQLVAEAAAKAKAEAEEKARRLELAIRRYQGDLQHIVGNLPRGGSARSEGVKYARSQFEQLPEELLADVFKARHEMDTLAGRGVVEGINFDYFFRNIDHARAVLQKYVRDEEAGRFFSFAPSANVSVAAMN